MAFVVEDGTAPDGANSYCDEDEFDAYCEDNGITPADGDTEAALVRATTAIDNAYRGGFPGYRTYFRDQSLEWPRQAAYDIEGNLIDSHEIPIEVKQATMEAAVRELTTAGVMQPDLARGGWIRSVAAGSVRVEYGAQASAVTTFTKIDGIISRVLTSSDMSGLTGTTVRG